MSVSLNQTNQLIKLKKLSWVSHRGLALEADENTLEAFRAASASGFDRFETDLRTSRDGQLILAHDISFARLGGPNVPLWDLTAQAITKIKLAQGGSPARLEQVLEEFCEKKWTFDIKPEQSDRTIRFLSRMIESNAWHDRVATGQYKFLFWKKRDQSRFLQLFPEADCYARYEECRKVGLAYLFRMGWASRPQRAKTYSLPASFKGINLFRKEIVEYFHKYHANLCAFLPANDAQTQAALAAGFDEILTDFAPVKK